MAALGEGTETIVSPCKLVVYKCTNQDGRYKKE